MKGRNKYDSKHSGKIDLGKWRHFRVMKILALAINILASLDDREPKGNVYNMIWLSIRGGSHWRYRFTNIQTCIQLYII